MRRVELGLCVVLGIGACAGSAPPSRNGTDDPCADFELDVRRVWSDETKVNLRASLMDQWSSELDVHVAQEKAQEIETSMDRVAQDWVMLRRSACMDHFKRSVGTADDYRSRTVCFDRVLQRQRAAIEALARDAAAGRSALDAIGQELDSCR